MKKMLMLLVGGSLLAGTAGCHVVDCWNYAWNSRFHPEKLNPQPAQRCVVLEECDPCCNPCPTCAPAITPAPCR